MLYFSMMIGYVGGNNSNAWHGYFLAVALLLWNVFASTLSTNVAKLWHIMRTRVRTAIVAVIYRKVYLCIVTYEDDTNIVWIIWERGGRICNDHCTDNQPPTP